MRLTRTDKDMTYVKRVEPGSLAEFYGLKTGDVLAKPDTDGNATMGLYKDFIDGIESGERPVVIEVLREIHQSNPPLCSSLPTKPWWTATTKGLGATKKSAIDDSSKGSHGPKTEDRKSSSDKSSKGDTSDDTSDDEVDDHRVLKTRNKKYARTSSPNNDEASNNVSTTPPHSAKFATHS